MSKVKKFKTDEWVYYYQFADANFERLRNKKEKAVILAVLDKRDFYDYRIFVDDGTSTIKNVKEEFLRAIEV